MRRVVTVTKASNCLASWFGH